MSRLSQLGMSLLALSVVLWSAGCSASTPQSEDQSTESNGEDHDHGDDGDDHGDHADHDHGDHEHGDADSAKIEKALAKLSAEDRTLAEQQKICPVTEELLGSMGTPIKLTVKGQDVFICCAGCEEDLRDDPEKYLAMLKK